jgi:hypothetical protein
MSFESMFCRLQQDSSMSLYEVLDAGALCKLYFDLEYKRALNPGRASAIDSSLPQLLLQLADEALSDTNRSCDANSLWVLDASSAEKFSQHIIVSLTGCPYVGSVHDVGQLVQCIVKRAAQLPQLFVTTSQDGACGCVIDTSVYATNQQLRVMFSSKFGQNRPLLPINKCAGLQLHACSWQVFRTSLVTCKRLPAVVDQRSSVSSSGSCTAAHRLCVHPAANSLIHCDIVHLYPNLILFLCSQLHNGTVVGAKVHRARPLEVPYMYCSTTSKWCSTVGREHAGNHIQLVVNVLSCTWRQHCLDPACSPAEWQDFEPSLLQRVCEPISSSVRDWHEHWKLHRNVTY